MIDYYLPVEDKDFRTMTIDGTNGGDIGWLLKKLHTDVIVESNLDDDHAESGRTLNELARFPVAVKNSYPLLRDHVWTQDALSAQHHDFGPFVPYDDTKLSTAYSSML